MALKYDNAAAGICAGATCCAPSPDSSSFSSSKLRVSICRSFQLLSSQTREKTVSYRTKGGRRKGVNTLDAKAARYMTPVKI